MDQLHHHKAKSGYEFPIATLDPEEFIHKWQARAAKLLHAQERIAQGFAAATRAQLRYGQEFMASRAGVMHWDVADASHLGEQARHDVEQFAALMREVSEEIRSGFTEAGKMLSEDAPEEIRKAMEAMSSAANGLAEKAEAASAEAVARANAGAEELAETQQKAGEAMADAVRKTTRRTKAAGED